MATAPLETPMFEDDEHRLWNQSFDQQMRRELIEDDLHAGRNVCGILIAIAVGGLLLGIAAVLLCA